MADVRIIGVNIACPFERANAFLSDPENFALWASGLGKGLRREGEAWVVETPEGVMHVRFTPRNEWGVLDHHVWMEGGPEIAVPMRVIPNGGGCHVSLTLLRLAGMTDEKYAADAGWVERDLQTLKRVLEG